MDSLRATFREEALELLSSLEEALLGLEKNLTDDEALSTAFRAVHTIKGSGGIFDFDELVCFSHEVEDLLDALRNKRLPVTLEIAALLITASDHLVALINHFTTDTPESALKHLVSVSNTILLQLRRLMDTSEKAVDIDTSALPQNTKEAEVFNESTHPRFIVRLKTDLYRHGLAPEKALRFLFKYSSLEYIKLITTDLPSAQNFDPEDAILVFEVAFQKTVSHEDAARELNEAFEFLLSRVSITQIAKAIHTVPEKGAGSGVNPTNENKNPSNANTTKASSVESEQTKASKQLRVSSDKLDLLVDLVGELVMKNGTLQQLSRETQTKEFMRPVSEMTRLVENVRELAMNLRMVPIGRTFHRMERVVRDAAGVSGKMVRLELKGEDTELDKSVIERIGDPLMHIVRNSVDHGIESVEARLEQGKPQEGVVSLSAYNAAGAIVIEVTDDGRGLDLSRILEKARAKGIADTDREYSESEIQQFIFAHGFSTAEAVTEISGRGVGMDVVKKNIDALRGVIRIQSVFGQGMTLRIVLPLTLAIIDGFVVRVGAQKFVFPLESVKECLDFSTDALNDDTRNQIFNLRGEALPYTSLSSIFNIEHDSSERASLVIVEDGERRFGIVVDEPLGEHKTVIKPLTGLLANLRGIGGATILGAREMAFIIDVPGIIDLIGKGRRSKYEK
ncbi:MAG TPA: chemotaxis protein CheA [Turneriella sp.]|nr:chemotaxis protein CheA [Turneriella sp.]